MSQLKALHILEKPMTAKEFGLIMWRNNPMHNKKYKSRNGYCKGKGGWLLAGSYLAKLIKKGLVEKKGTKFNLTKKGKLLNTSLWKY